MILERSNYFHVTLNLNLDNKVTFLSLILVLFLVVKVINTSHNFNKPCCLDL